MLSSKSLSKRSLGFNKDTVYLVVAGYIFKTKVNLEMVSCKE